MLTLHSLKALRLFFLQGIFNTPSIARETEALSGVSENICSRTRSYKLLIPCLNPVLLSLTGRCETDPLVPS